ncbi:MAG: PilW family protein [Candidatus Hydrogenedentota bacterium]
MSSGCTQQARQSLRGFTLAEVLVATTLLSIVMASVYALFGSTLRTWRSAEDKFDNFQNVRVASTVIKREINNILPEGGYFFQGEGHDFEMVVVSEPFNVDDGDGEGRRLMLVRYRFNRTGQELLRQEAQVTMALPQRRRGEDKIDRGRLKTSKEEEYVVARNVRSFDVRYVWMPVPAQRDPNQPPPRVRPIRADRHEEGWGLPNGIEIKLVVEDPENEEDETHTFLIRRRILAPARRLDEQKILNMLGAVE